MNTTRTQHQNIRKTISDLGEISCKQAYQLRITANRAGLLRLRKYDIIINNHPAPHLNYLYWKRIATQPRLTNENV